MIVRSGPKVERARAATLEQALDELEARTRAAATARGRTGTLDLRIRSFEPGEQVVVRGELRGPGRWRPAVQAGLDVRGDGDLQAWTGRATRTAIEPEDGESAYQALRREVTRRTAAR